MSIAPRLWQAATTAINDANGLVISCHLHPDGDSLVSALALHGALVNAGRAAVVSFSEPFEVAAQYRFLPGVERLTPPREVPDSPEVFVCFDTGSLDRLGSLAGAFQRAKRTLVIDHHASNTRFGDVNLIDPDAPASAVLCRELLRRLDLPIDQEIATDLYTSLVWTSVTQDDLEAYGIGMDATEGLIDLVRTDGASDVAAVLKEQPDGGIKVSLRSKGATNVAEVAGRFGGGGHALAAGFTSDRDAAGTIDAIVEALVAQRAATGDAGATGDGRAAAGEAGATGDGGPARAAPSAATSGR